MDKVLAFTTTYGTRNYLSTLVPDARATSGCWFDWLVVLGDPSPDLLSTATTLLNDPSHTGIQFLKTFPENRGQHWATKAALDLAREKHYDWLLRIDDDITFKTKGWLRGPLTPDTRGRPRMGMLDRAEWLKVSAGDPEFRFIYGPMVNGLKYPIPPIATLEKDGQPFRAQMVELLGGALRLHSMKMLWDYEPDLYAPRGRSDPQSLKSFIQNRQAAFIRFPDIRVNHPTEDLEACDSPDQAQIRDMSKVWPFLESPEV